MVGSRFSVSCPALWKGRNSSDDQGSRRLFDPSVVHRIAHLSRVAVRLQSQLRKSGSRAWGVPVTVRVALVLYLIIVGSVFGAIVGRGKRRGRIMLAATLGGVSGGVFVAYVLSYWVKADLSDILSCVGVSAGWAA